MTETTDTAALREACEILNDRGYITESGEICSRNLAVAVRMIIEQSVGYAEHLEAERQRAAGSEGELHKALHREKAAERKLLAAQGEIAALKGEQVPVDDLQAEIKALMRTYALVSSPSTMAAAHDAGYAFVKAKGFNRILAALFTAPQKPVVLPEYKFCPAEHQGSLLWSETEVWNKAIDASKAAIEAAGGIVKEEK